jgi:hypothetical protein
VLLRHPYAGDLYAEIQDHLIEIVLGRHRRSEIQTPRGQEKTNVIKYNTDDMEGEPNNQYIEILQMQTLGKEIEELTEEFILSKDIPYEVKAPVLEEAASLVHDIFQAPRNKIPLVEVLQQKQEALRKKGGVIFVGQPKPPEIGQPPDLSEIPKWRGRNQDGKPLDFIGEHYGKWLLTFGAEQDAIYQDQIRRHDPKLLRGMIDQLRREGQGRKIKEFVKPRSVRTDRELAGIEPDTLIHADRLSTAMRHRQAYRARKAPKPSSE